MKTAITPTRAENYPDWYQSVVKAAELAETSPVRGCMVIKPWGFALWELIQQALDGMIKATGHQNVSMPTLIPMDFLAKEAEHVEGFAKETMVMTHYRLIDNGKGGLKPDPTSELEEPYILRPTSETMFGYMYAKWIQSYRDLPLKLNQWGSVFRWEMRTRLFLRTAEFLWQEGHTAHATQAEAVAETVLMHNVYRDLLENYLAMAVIPGTKTPDELFPGALTTYTLEAMMQDKKALQASTSHFLGQNFAKAANIEFLDQDGERKLVWTTSWGASTRMVGGLIMAHSDDNGLVLPPRVAPAQVIILPIYRSDEDKLRVLAAVEELQDQLQKQTAFGVAVRVKVDDRELRGGEKSWQAIKQGVPLRVELGPKDLDKHQICLTRRDAQPKDKQFVSQADFIAQVGELLETMQAGLFEKSKQNLAANTQTVTSLDEFKAFFKADGGFAQAYWCEDAINHPLLDQLKVTPRCIPEAGQPNEVGECIFTGKPTKVQVVFARAY